MYVESSEYTFKSGVNIYVRRIIKLINKLQYKTISKLLTYIFTYWTQPGFILNVYWEIYATSIYILYCGTVTRTKVNRCEVNLFRSRVVNSFKVRFTMFLCFFGVVNSKVTAILLASFDLLFNLILLSE